MFVVAVLGHLAVLYAPTAPSAPGLPGIDKVVHVAAFGAVVWAGRTAGLRRWPVVLAALLHAPLSEGVQHWVLPGRSGDPLDVVADLVGVAVGALLPLVPVRPVLVVPRPADPSTTPAGSHGTMDR